MAAVSSSSKDLVHHVILEAGTAVPVTEPISTAMAAKAATHLDGVSAVAAPLPAVAAADWQIVRMGAASLDELLKKLSAAKCRTPYLPPRPDLDSARPIVFERRSSPRVPRRWPKNLLRRSRCLPIRPHGRRLRSGESFAGSGACNVRGSPFCFPGRDRSTRACFASWYATFRRRPPQSSDAPRSWVGTIALRWPKSHGRRIRSLVPTCFSRRFRCWWPTR